MVIYGDPWFLFIVVDGYWWLVLASYGCLWSFMTSNKDPRMVVYHSKIGVIWGESWICMVVTIGNRFTIVMSG